MDAKQGSTCRNARGSREAPARTRAPAQASWLPSSSASSETLLGPPRPCSVIAHSFQPRPRPACRRGKPPRPPARRPLLPQHSRCLPGNGPMHCRAPSVQGGVRRCRGWGRGTGARAHQSLRAAAEGGGPGHGRLRGRPTHGSPVLRQCQWPQKRGPLGTAVLHLNTQCWGAAAGGPSPSSCCQNSVAPASSQMMHRRSPVAAPVGGQGPPRRGAQPGSQGDHGQPLAWGRRGPQLRGR